MSSREVRLERHGLPTRTLLLVVGGLTAVLLAVFGYVRFEEWATGEKAGDEHSWLVVPVAYGLLALILAHVYLRFTSIKDGRLCVTGFGSVSLESITAVAVLHRTPDGELERVQARDAAQAGAWVPASSLDGAAGLAGGAGLLFSSLGLVREGLRRRRLTTNDVVSASARAAVAVYSGEATGGVWLIESRRAEKVADAIAQAAGVERN